MSHGLPPRRGATEAERALVTSVVEGILAERATRSIVGAVPSWRFSGRWFAAGPYGAMRRPQR